MSTTTLAAASPPGTPARASRCARTTFPPTWSAGNSWLIDSAIHLAQIIVLKHGRSTGAITAYQPRALAVIGTT